MDSVNDFLRQWLEASEKSKDKEYFHNINSFENDEEIKMFLNRPSSDEETVQRKVSDQYFKSSNYKKRKRIEEVSNNVSQNPHKNQKSKENLNLNLKFKNINGINFFENENDILNQINKRSSSSSNSTKKKKCSRKRRKIVVGKKSNKITNYFKFSRNKNLSKTNNYKLYDINDKKVTSSDIFNMWISDKYENKSPVIPHRTLQANAISVTFDSEEKNKNKDNTFELFFNEKEYSDKSLINGNLILEIPKYSKMIPKENFVTILNKGKTEENSSELFFNENEKSVQNFSVKSNLLSLIRKNSKIIPKENSVKILNRGKMLTTENTKNLNINKPNSFELFFKENANSLEDLNNTKCQQLPRADENFRNLWETSKNKTSLTNKTSPDSFELFFMDCSKISEEPITQNNVSYKNKTTDDNPYGHLTLDELYELAKKKNNPEKNIEYFSEIDKIKICEENNNDITKKGNKRVAHKRIDIINSQKLPAQELEPTNKVNHWLNSQTTAIQNDYSKMLDDQTKNISIKSECQNNNHEQMFGQSPVDEYYFQNQNDLDPLLSIANSIVSTNIMRDNILLVEKPVTIENYLVKILNKDEQILVDLNDCTFDFGMNTTTVENEKSYLNTELLKEKSNNNNNLLEGCIFKNSDKNYKETQKNKQRINNKTDLTKKVVQSSVDWEKHFAVKYFGKNEILKPEDFKGQQSAINTPKEESNYNFNQSNDFLKTCFALNSTERVCDILQASENVFSQTNTVSKEKTNSSYNNFKSDFQFKSPQDIFQQSKETTQKEESKNVSNRSLDKEEKELEYKILEASYSKSKIIKNDITHSSISNELSNFDDLGWKLLTEDYLVKSKEKSSGKVKKQKHNVFLHKNQNLERISSADISKKLNEKDVFESILNHINKDTKEDEDLSFLNETFDSNTVKFYNNEEKFLEILENCTQSEDYVANTPEIKKYRKGIERIYKIGKKVKDKTVKNTPEEKQLNLDNLNMDEYFEQMTQKDQFVEENTSFESFSSHDSYNTIRTKFDPSLLPSSNTRLQTKLMEGFIQIVTDSSLLPNKNKEENLIKPLGRREIISKIEEILINVANDFESKKSPCFLFPSERLENCVFKDGRIQLKPMKDVKMTKVAFSNANSKKRFCLILFILEKVRKLLIYNTKLTKREIYYQIKTYVQNQGSTDRAISSVSLLLNTAPWDLHITAQKGLVYGNLTIKMYDGETLNCNIPGVSVPMSVKNIIEIKSGACFILVIEKESIFHKLIQEDLPNRINTPFIMITGKGYPDYNTQLFLKKLWLVLSVPVFILVDPDPHGIKIMLDYRFGCVKSAHLSHHLAVPNARWLGVFPSEIHTLTISKEELSPKDKTLLKSMLNLPFWTENPKIYEEINFMLRENVKSGIEGLVKNESYLSNIYLTDKFYKKSYI